MANKTSEITGQAIAVLAQIGDTQALIGIIEEESDNTATKLAMSALGELKCQEAVDPIIYCLLSQFGSVQSAAIRALGDIGNPRAVKPLIKMLRNPEKPTAEILEALGKIDDPMAIKAIIETLANEPSEVAELASTTLKHLGPKAVKPLLSIINDVDKNNKLKIIKVLGQIGDASASSLLVKITTNENEDLDIREEAAKALAKIGKGIKVEEIIQMVVQPVMPGDKYYTLYCYLITLLGETGDFRATETLTRLLLNKNNELGIRYHAVNALGRLGDSSAIESLKSVMKEPCADSSIKSSAIAALLALDKSETASDIIAYLKTQPSFMDNYRVLGPGNI